MITQEQRAEYVRLYALLARASRDHSIATHRLAAYFHELEIEHDVPPGKRLDVWGDGSIKEKSDCAPAPEI